MPSDHHGRAARGAPDRRRRPVDGYRLPSARRFSELVLDVVATLPEPVAGALAGAEVRTSDIPPVEQPLRDGMLPLVRVTGSRGRARLVEVYRRPLELRALSRLDLAELVQAAIAHEAAAVLGLELGEEWDEG